jgi:hypothetical protein
MKKTTNTRNKRIECKCSNSVEEERMMSIEAMKSWQMKGVAGKQPKGREVCRRKCFKA